METMGIWESGEDQLNLLVTSVLQAVEVWFRPLFVTFPRQHRALCLDANNVRDRIYPRALHAVQLAGLQA